MHRLVPNFILQEYAAGRTPDSFQAVGLFVDISGAEARWPEELLQESLELFEDMNVPKYAGAVRQRLEALTKLLFCH